VRDADGGIVASATGSTFDFPEDGLVAHVGGAAQTASGVELTNVVLLGGRIRADRIDVPTRGFAGLQVGGLVVDGVSKPVKPDTLAMIPGVGYLIAAQEATAGAQQGAVGLRLHLLAQANGLAAGTEILVAPSGARVLQSPPASAPAQVSVLGFTFGPDMVVGSTPLGYPLAAHGVISACPFTPGSTHSPFVPPANLESDDAIDINVAIGTPILAVADGVIGSQIGSLNSADPHMQGLRLHLDTQGHRYYYAHLSRIDVLPGQQVVAGQQLGLSGSAAGVAHLHFAQDGGNPAATIGEALTCPFFAQYDEPW
jgi:murein DD-endopeptidase MepM/ murein hydrolase activator NlpD